MNRFYVYKMTVDNGGAPCIRRGVLSLAICKPRIRHTAKKGDIVFGFAANQLGDAIANNGLIYVAKITNSVRGEEYYSSAKFSRRPDCIYLWNGKRFSRRKGAKFHNSQDDLKHDLGVHPGYVKARILLSDKFRYFREKSPITLRDRTRDYPCLSRLIGSLAQGERVNHPFELRGELERLLASVWRRKSAYSATPTPKSACYDSCRDEKQKITIC